MVNNGQWIIVVDSRLARIFIWPPHPSLLRKSTRCDCVGIDATASASATAWASPPKGEGFVRIHFAPANMTVNLKSIFIFLMERPSAAQVST